MSEFLPFNDAAPSANGAGVNDPNLTPDLTQLRLVPPSHHNAPAGTSEVAADRIGIFAQVQRKRIYTLIALRGTLGTTDDEGEEVLKIKPQSYTPRRNELVKLGLIVDSGVRRLTSSGRPAAVWVLPEHAMKIATHRGGAHS